MTSKYSSNLKGIIEGLNGIELGERKAVILEHLTHALSESSKHVSQNMYEHGIEALKQLRKARHSLRLDGAKQESLDRIECAVVYLCELQKEWNDYYRISSRTVAFISFITSVDSLIYCILLLIVFLSGYLLL